MTLLESRPPPAPTKSAPPKPDPRAVKAARAAATDRVVRLASGALVALSAALGLFALFDGPIANAWYTNRQHHLAADWKAKHPHVGNGHAIALLQIPALKVNLLIAEGDTPQQLRSGPGHRVGTPMPGDVGNSVIVGHRDAWGGPLSRIGELKPGAYLAIQTKDSTGPIGVFKVVSVDRVNGNDVSPFGQSTDRRVTIVSGTGGRYSDRRLVITAVSGKAGKVTGGAGPATTAAGSPIWNAYVALAAGALAAGSVLALVLRRGRYRRPAVVAVVAPFLTLALLLVLLDVDALLPALR